MTDRDRIAVDALARHFAYEDGGCWEHLDKRQQATYRARALDVVSVVGPIYQPTISEAHNAIAATIADHLGAASIDGPLVYKLAGLFATFPRPMSKEPTK